MNIGQQRLVVGWLLAAILLFGTLGAGWLSINDFRPSTLVRVRADGYEMAGYLSEGRSTDGIWAILVHGNRAQGQDHLLYRRILGKLDEDVSVLAIDMRGFGESRSQDFEADDPILDRTGDIEAAAAYLHDRYGVDQSKIVLIGHSLGALQVLRAGQERRYRMVISIGPGDMREFLLEPDSLRRYSAKLGASMSMPIAPEGLAEEGQAFLPRALFTPCPDSPTAFVFGAFDLQESLRRATDEIPNECLGGLEWVTIPLADHMYWTELTPVPEPFRSTASWLPVTLLLGQLNRLLLESSSP